MSDWKPWRDDPDAPDELRALFAAGRAPRSMTANERARARARVTAMAGAGAAGWFAMSAWARAMTGGKLMTAAAVLSVGAAAASSVLAVRVHEPVMAAHAVVPVGSARSIGTATANTARTRPTPPPRVVTTNATPVMALAAAQQTASESNAMAIAIPARAPTDAPHAIAAAPRVRRSGHGSVEVAAPVAASEPMAEVDPLVRESELLQGAMRLLASDPRSALRLADAHAREFPNGQLAAERTYVRVRALARLGRTDEAVSEARALIEAHPHSEYAARVSRALESGGGLR